MRPVKCINLVCQLLKTNTFLSIGYQAEITEAISFQLELDRKRYFNSQLLCVLFSLLCSVSRSQSFC